MKWEDIPYEHYIPYEENRMDIRSNFLKSLNVDMDNLPNELLDIVRFYDKDSVNNLQGKEEKVFVKDVVGSCYSDYSNIMLIQVFYRLKRAAVYINRGDATPTKYMWQLKQPLCKQWVSKNGGVPIGFIRKDKDYYIYRNGNHRFTLYKIMYLAALNTAKTQAEIDKINSRYYLKAMVYEA